ncbi:MAG TPA: outer membrane lipoprotein chaperone LolA [Gammaproteobacteria bacterium]
MTTDLLRLAALTVALAAVSDALPQPSTPAAEAEPGAAALEAFLTDVHSLEAEFAQELWDADNRLLETAKGTVSLERPNRFLWRYSEPLEQVIVADGQEVWIYDVDLAQATVTPIDETTEASPALLLSGDAAVRDSFTVVDSFSHDGLEWVRLEPKVPGADFTSVLIGFESSTPRRLELVDGLSQVTRIELLDVALNPDLPAELFEFEPPAGVDVIGERG